jgi:hypothetical protein
VAAKPRSSGAKESDVSEKSEKNEKRLKRPELRTILLPRGATLGELASAVIVKMTENGPYYAKRAATLFRGDRNMEIPTDRKDIFPIGFNAGAFKGPDVLDQVARHLGCDKKASLKQVLKAIMESHRGAEQLTFSAPKKVLLPPIKKPEKLRPLGDIVSHRRAHEDEFVNQALIILYGRGRRWTWKKETPPTITFADDEHDAIARFGERRDAVMIGIGGDVPGLKAMVFDEHRTEGRLENTCATDLAAQFLELDGLPNFQWLLSEVRRSDVEAGQGPLGLGQLLKVVQRYGKYDAESLLVWFEFMSEVVSAVVNSGQAFERPLDLGLALKVISRFGSLKDEARFDIVGRVIAAFEKRGEEFNEICPKEFNAKGKIEVLPDGTRLAWVTSDRYTMNAWARNQRQADVVVQHFSSGHIRVFSKPSARAQMTLLAQRVMVEEMLARGKDEDAVYRAQQAFTELCARPNDLPGGIPWYFHTGSQLGGASLLNGSDSHKSEPTKLSLERMVELVKTVIESMTTTKPPETVAVAEAPAAPDLTSALLAAAEAEPTVAANGGE